MDSDFYEIAKALYTNSDLNNYWASVQSLLNSNFITAFAGAGAGALGAQYLVERTKLREELIKEIRGTNKASVIALGIFNSLLNIKKQHIKGLKENFDMQKIAYEKHAKGQELAEPDWDALKLKMDLQNLTMPKLPMKILQIQVFEKLSLIGRPLNLASYLHQTLTCLYSSLEERNQLISSFKSLEFPQSMHLSLYLGIPNKNTVDSSYPDLINAIYTYTDDSIFFSYLLCEDLIAHGQQITINFQNKLGKEAPKVNIIDFTDAKKSGLMPDVSNYKDWYDKYKLIPKRLSLFKKLCNTLAR